MNTPTTAPSFKNKALIVEPVKTQTKITQGTSFFEHVLKENITIQFPHGHDAEYQAGQIPNVQKGEEGFYMVDGYGCHEIEGYTLNGKTEKTNYLPVELFETKQYTIVREYKTTVWEIK